MKPIYIKAIPHANHRYETCGDYWEGDDIINFRVSDMKNPDYEFLVILHELIEYWLIQKKGIRIKDIDDFDIKFEEERALGLHSVDEEPGDSCNAPYREEHQFATIIEKEVARAMDIDWDDYDKTIMNLI